MEGDYETEKNIRTNKSNMFAKIKYQPIQTIQKIKTKPKQYQTNRQ
jgi:hypothetical protein